MDIYSKVLSKSSISWNDVQKNLKLAIQGRNFSVNKTLIKQATDLLVRHIKNLSQNQVSEQLESLSQTGHLGFNKISKDNQNILTVYLHSDDFYFEVPISISGEIGDVKFAMFNEAAQSSVVLRNIFCHEFSSTWNWDLLIENIDGIKSLYILPENDRTIRENAYKALKILENDLILISSFYKQYYKKTETVIKESIVGLFKKSEIGYPMRLYYFLSPQDLILHDECSPSLLENLDDDSIFNNELGAYFTISLTKFKISNLPDCSLHRMDPNLEKIFFDNTIPYKGYEVPGTFLITLNQPVIICLDTLEDLEAKIGIKILDWGEEFKIAPYFELLATTVHGRIQSDSFLVQLPEETQIYYVTEVKKISAVKIQKIPFTHPSHIQDVIRILRKQLLLNELALSCMRKTCYSSIGFKKARILELGLISNLTISVVMKHPSLLCYTTIEIDVSDGFVRTTFKDHSNLHDANVINEVFHRCHSIPVTIRALLMKYKKTNMLLNEHNSENGNASIQQQVFGQNLFDSNLKFKSESMLHQSFNTQTFEERNEENSCKENYKHLKTSKGDQKIEFNNEIVDNRDLFSTEADEEFDRTNEIIDLKNVLIDSSRNANKSITKDAFSFLNTKKRKAAIDTYLPYAKKKVEDSEELKPTKRIINLQENISLNECKNDDSTVLVKACQADIYLDGKKFKNGNLDKCLNKSSNSTINSQKPLLLNSGPVKMNTTNTLTTEKQITKGKTTHTKVLSKDGKLNTEANNSNLKKKDSNFSTVSMKIKSMTKDGLKLRISKETSKSNNSVQIISPAVSPDSSKHQLINNSSNTNASINTTIENYIINQNNPASTSIMSKSTPLNESLNEKILELPKYEPKPKVLEKKSQFKRSISSAPTTPNYNDNTSINQNSIKSKCATPPSCLEMANTPSNQLTKAKTNISSVFPKSTSVTIKSNFKIPKAKSNQESQEITPTTNNAFNSQRNFQPISAKKIDNSNETYKGLSNTASINFNTSIETIFNQNLAKDSINRTFSNKQSSNLNQANYSTKQLSNKEKNNLFSSKLRISPNEISPLLNNRPLTPVQTSNFSQYNRNAKTLSISDTNKNRNTISMPILSPLSNTNITSGNMYFSNQIILTPTSPINSMEDEIPIPSKLTTIIPPDSPANNTCETTTIPKLIPLERNEITNGINENSDYQAFSKIEYKNEEKRRSQYKFENSPEENNLIIDLVSTTNSLLTPTSDKLDKASSFIDLSESKIDSRQKGSPISYSKTNFPDVYDNDSENDLKVII